MNKWSSLNPPPFPLGLAQSAHIPSFQQTESHEAEERKAYAFTLQNESPFFWREPGRPDFENLLKTEQVAAPKNPRTFQNT